ncbi:hypothetical protein BDW02DRAFT_571143 [Decorospora gaudefroyi]|uniref:Uncharacterized protein n=1 Tax=Decorospora gaudefroyi TaxID=184978 RepID=A0A6A5KB11_9PLEO|nr:hypothetical protein BDW02DRAFT_571143 [Decorospora gaudefroyi]
MAVDNSLESLLTTLTDSIQSATEALPTDSLLPPKDGISLLDAKSEMLLSYLQNLVFLILLKLRSRKGSQKDLDLQPQDDVVSKLVELRVYLEKGVRPLESRLKYQIDKILRTADEATRRNNTTHAKPSSMKAAARIRKPDTSDDSDDASSTGTAQTQDSDDDEMAYAPRRAHITRQKTEADQERARSAAAAAAKDGNGIYRPPKITPMAMPTPEARREQQQRRPGKSATLDEFIATELSSAPIAEPSIGSTITHGGRHTKSDRERREEKERREYEEANFTRLAPLSKKEEAKRKARLQRNGGFGGEEWRGLGAGIERIERLTQKNGRSGSRGLGSLEKSRKRAVGDGPLRGGGSGGAAAVGDAFEKRRKVVGRYK